MRRYYILIFYLLISLFIFRNIIAQPGFIGYRHDWNIPPFREQLLKMAYYTDGLSAWNRSQLGSPTFYPTLAFFNLFLALLGLIGFNGAIVTKLLLVVLLSLIGWSMYYLGITLKLGRGASFLAGFLYMLTPFVFNRIAGGNLPELVSYALLPLLIAAVEKSMAEREKPYPFAVLAGLALSFMSVQFQYLIFGVLLILLYSLFAPQKRELGKRVKALLVVGGVFFLLNSFWILPIFQKYQQMNRLTKGVESLGFVEFWSPRFSEVIRLQGNRAAFFENSLRESFLPYNLWMGLSFLLPFLVIGCLLSAKAKRRLTLFVVFTFMLALFFAKGTNPPLGGIYGWLYLNLPFATIFRESYRISAVVAFCYALMLGIFLGNLSARWKKGESDGKPPPKRSWISPWKINLMVILWVILFCNSFFSGAIEKNIQVNRLHPEYKKNYSQIEKLPGEFRILYEPLIIPMKPMKNLYSGVDPLISYPPKPSVGNYIPLAFNKILALNLNDDHPFLLQHLLNSLCIRYLIVRKDYTSDFREFAWYLNQYPDRYKLWDRKKAAKNIKKLSLVEDKKWSSGKITVFSNKSAYPFIYGVNPEEFYFCSTNLSWLDSLKLNKGLTLSDYQYCRPLTGESPLNVMLLNNDQLELTLSLVDSSYKLSPHQFATEMDAKRGWVNLLQWNSWWWYNWDYTMEGGETTFTRAQTTLKFPLAIWRETNYSVFIKAYQGFKSGRIAVELAGQEFTLNTKSEFSKGFRWFYLGSISLRKGKYRVIMSNLEGESAVARLAVVPSKELTLAQELAFNVLRSSRVGYLFTNY
ncbi:MAG: DUF6541 family protein [Acidobacteriota bacterium]